ncbi:hypothetical protein PMG11_07258 [Penicillium brasilianum]|uniref:Uncharacterized protein n=1 Tax=Penicillium brasilianum TaxID=104259 RepID=A0A0F7TS27_PENBI|nr:hypothetical protein PMG11_07258 [Penicillium brasilianum]
MAPLYPQLMNAFGRNYRDLLQDFHEQSCPRKISLDPLISWFHTFANKEIGVHMLRSRYEFSLATLQSEIVISWIDMVKRAPFHKTQFDTVWSEVSDFGIKDRDGRAIVKKNKKSGWSGDQRSSQEE